MTGDSETGNVYLHSVSGIFRCYDKDGNVLWDKSLFEEFGKISGYGGRTQTAIIDENRIIVGFFGLNWGKSAAPPPLMTYYAFDKLSGDLLWTSPVGEAPKDTNYSNPVIAVVDGQRLLVGGGADGGVHAINARTGEPVWSFRMSKRGLNATAAVDGDMVYISHGEDNIDTIDFGRIECINAKGTGDITETNSVWRVDGIKAGYTGLVVKDGILYVIADTGKLHAFDSKTGEELWEYSLGTVGKGSPVWADPFRWNAAEQCCHQSHQAAVSETR
jgi:outer membrane protein assembly factor BamB